MNDGSLTMGAIWIVAYAVFGAATVLLIGFLLTREHWTHKRKNKREDINLQQSHKWIQLGDDGELEYGLLTGASPPIPDGDYTLTIYDDEYHTKRGEIIPPLPAELELGYISTKR